MSSVNINWRTKTLLAPEIFIDSDSGKDFVDIATAETDEESDTFEYFHQSDSGAILFR